MADANIVIFGNALGGGTIAVPDNNTSALEIDSIDDKNYLAVNTTDSAEKLILAAGGAKVGIGEADPDTVLHVHDDAGAHITISGNATTDDVGISLESLSGVRYGLLTSNGNTGVLKLRSGSTETGGGYSVQLASGGSSTEHIGLILSSTGKLSTGGETTSMGDSAGSLHIFTGNSGQTDITGNADDLIVEGIENTGLSIACPSDHQGQIAFTANGTSNDRGAITYLHNAMSSGEAMTFRVNDAVRATIDSSGKVGIGAAPEFCADKGLHIQTGDSTALAVDVHADADDLIVEGGGNAGITIFTTPTGEANLYFRAKGPDDSSSEGNTPDGIKVKKTSNNSMHFQVGNAERFRVLHDGVIRIESGGKLSTGSESSPLCAANGIHIKESESNVTSANSHADMLVIESGSHPGISLLGTNSDRNTIAFGDPQNNMAGELRYTHGGGSNADMFFLIMHNSVAINVDHDHKLGVNHECADASGQLQVNCPDGANVPCVVVDQNDSTNNPVALEIQNAGTGDSILDDSGAKLTAAGVFTDASDISLKSDIETIPYGLETVLQLRPVGYDYKKTGQADIGFIAQEVEQIIPEVVFGENGSKSMSYGHLVAVLTKALQEMHTQIQELKNGN